MLQFIKSNYKLLIGIMIGIMIPTLQGLSQNILFLEATQLIIFGITFLYFTSFTLLELFIYVNKELQILKVLEVKYNYNMRALSITMNNDNLLDGRELFEAIYNTIMSNDEFINFGFQKIIILTCMLDDYKEYNLHSNVLINNDTTFTEYYNEISNDLSGYHNLEYGYHNLNIVRYTVKVWDCSNLNNLNIKITHNTITMEPLKNQIIQPMPNTINQRRSYSTKVNYKKTWFKGIISPISLFNKLGKKHLESPAPIFTMDIETMNIKDIQIPIAISSCGMVNNKIEGKLFLIDHISLKQDLDAAVKSLWSQYFSYLESLEFDNISKLTIFAHNLGDFDGYFLYKGLMNYYNPENISSIIDESNSFISIKLLSGKENALSFEWKDSLRVFPLSLNKLCNLFGVDIESIYSTATLSLKIFRTRFLDEDIFILKQHIDLFIRQGYFGGGTDVYKAYGKLLHYYDVNSLYPFAMLNDMPHELILGKDGMKYGGIQYLQNRSLDSFFGFAEAHIDCPTNMKRPVLPFHKDGKTIYPVGTWKGVYFSEELKAVAKLGYKITLIKGYEFTRIDLFSKFINTFFEMKRVSQGAEKAIAKLLLNNLYGYFGRKQINILTQNVKNDNLEPLLLTRVIKSISEINDEYSTVLAYSNINYKILDKLNNELHNNIENFYSPIKSNVAIAAAVTAYARIVMIPFKLDPNTLYTDTDSIFTTKPIDPNLIGDLLGQMKDEMRGVLIQEGLFLGPKKYGYWYFDKDNNKVEASVFSGVPRNSLTFDEIKTINQGNVIIKNVSNRFFKSFNSLNISIKDTFISIKNTNDKLLVNNEYLPIKITNGEVDLLGFLFNKFKNLVIKTINKYFK